MALNNSNEAVIAKRREHVAALLLANKTQRQIMEELAVLMPEHEVSLGTVNSDVKAIKAVWRKSATDKVDKFIALHNARVEEIIAALWPRRSVPRTAEVLLRALERQAKMLGLDKPTKQETSGPDGGPIAIVPVDVNYRAAIAALKPQDDGGE